jgi:AcrR family transcriptional regulator
MAIVERSTAEQIEQIALDLLEREGPAAVSMRKIAAVAGITPMAIYHYFASREELLQAVTNRQFSKLLSFIEARGRSIPPAANEGKRLIALMEGYVDYALAHPRIFDYVFSEPRPGARQYPDDFRSRSSPTLNPVADCIQEGIASGYFKKADVWELAFQSWAHVHGYVMLHRAGRIHLSTEDYRSLCRRSLERMIRGFKAQP